MDTAIRWVDPQTPLNTILAEAIGGIKNKKAERNKNNESMFQLKESEDQAKITSIDSKKLSKQDIEDMDDKLAKAHIQSLNTDFVIQNPYVHAFRSNSIKKPSEKKNLIERTQVDKNRVNKS